MTREAGQRQSAAEAAMTDLEFSQEVGHLTERLALHALRKRIAPGKTVKARVGGRVIASLTLKDKTPGKMEFCFSYNPYA